MCRLLLHLLHQPGALDHIGKARVVFDVGGDGELPARLDALDQNRLQHRPRGIDRGSVARRAGTDNDNFGVNGGSHGLVPYLKGVWSALWRSGARKGIAAASKVPYPI